MKQSSDFFPKRESLAITNRGNRWTKHKFFSFLICLVISFVLWYFFSYSQKQTAYLSLSLQVTKCPSGYILTGQSEKEISFQTSSSLSSFDKITKRNKIAVDLSDLSIEKIKGCYQGAFPVEPFLQKYFRQINYNGHFDELSQDTIVFFFETSAKKEVDVVLDVQYTVADQYRQYVPTAVSPQTVLLEGKKEIVDTIRFIKTHSIQLGYIQDTFSQMIALEKYQSLHLSHDSVHVFIPVTEFTEKQLEVAITAGTPDGSFFIKLLPDYVTISCLVSVEKFNSLTADMFTLEALYNSEMTKYEKKLQVKVIVAPEDVQITRIQPEYVDYIIVEQ